MVNIVQVKGVKTFANKHKLKISRDFYENLDKEVENLLKSSINRAKLNNRNTLMSKDL